MNVSGNQIPVQACNDNVPVNAVGLQGLATGLVPALGILSSGDVSAMQDSSCTQNPAEANSSSVTSSQLAAPADAEARPRTPGPGFRSRAWPPVAAANRVEHDPSAAFMIY